MLNKSFLYVIALRAGYCCTYEGDQEGLIV